MKKPYVYVIVALVVVAGGLVWYGVAHKTGSNMSSMNMNSSNSNNNAPVATSAVTIQNFAFSPANITVKTGTTVTWTNKDSVAHTVTESDSQTGPSSVDVDPGSNYTFTFKTPGTYHYHCTIHSEMVGTVKVTS